MGLGRKQRGKRSSGAEKRADQTTRIVPRDDKDVVREIQMLRREVATNLRDAARLARS